MTARGTLPRLAETISIHILHAEDDPEELEPDREEIIFQSTSSMRRMTFQLVAQVEHVAISIHILHAEDDYKAKDDKQAKEIFQSTSSMRRMTNFFPSPLHMMDISIHILHAEDDSTWLIVDV